MPNLQCAIFLLVGLAFRCSGEKPSSLSALSTSFCYYCLPAEKRGHQPSLDLTPAYIELAGPATPDLPIAFTACSATTTLPDDDGAQLLLSFLDQQGRISF